MSFNANVFFICFCGSPKKMLKVIYTSTLSMIPCWTSTLVSLCKRSILSVQATFTAHVTCAGVLDSVTGRLNQRVRCPLSFPHPLNCPSVLPRCACSDFLFLGLFSWGSNPLPCPCWTQVLSERCAQPLDLHLSDGGLCTPAAWPQLEFILDDLQERRKPC